MTEISMTPDHEAAVTAELVRLTIGQRGPARPELVTHDGFAHALGRIFAETGQALARAFDQAFRAKIIKVDPDDYTLMGD